MMKIKGRLLNFDQVIRSNQVHMFPSDCKIDIPKEVPLLYDFNSNQKALGMAHVERTETGLIVTADVFDDASEMVKGFESEFALGGLYTYVQYRQDAYGQPRIVDKCKLRSVSITPHPVNKDYDYEIIYEENLHAGGNE